MRKRKHYPVIKTVIYWGMYNYYLQIMLLDFEISYHIVFGKQFILIYQLYFRSFALEGVQNSIDESNAKKTMTKTNSR